MLDVQITRSKVSKENLFVSQIIDFSVCVCVFLNSIKIPQTALHVHKTSCIHNVITQGHIFIFYVKIFNYLNTFMTLFDDYELTGRNKQVH